MMHLSSPATVLLTLLVYHLLVVERIQGFSSSLPTSSSSSRRPYPYYGFISKTSRLRHESIVDGGSSSSSSSLCNNSTPPVLDRNIELNTTNALIYDPEQDRFVRDFSQSGLKLRLNESYSKGLSKVSKHTIARLKRAARHSFLPQGVNPSYYSFMRWRILQRFVNSNLHVLGTQSLIMGLGLKSSSSLGVSAAMTWVLKDALGKLTRLVWASKMGRRFDSDAKRWRFRASLVYALGNYLETVTYVNPSLFLLWAAAANSCKQVAMLTSSATRSALYNSFRDGKRENIADITAKGEAQIAVVDLIGISFGVSLSKAVGTSVRNVLTTYVILQVLEIFFLFREIRSVHFQVMNFERMAQVVDSFCDEILAKEEDDGGYITNATIAAISLNGSPTTPKTATKMSDTPTKSASHVQHRLVPTPEEVAKNERIFLPPKHLRRRALAFGSLSRSKLSPDEFTRLMQIFSKDRYILVVGEDVKNPRNKFERTTPEEAIQQNCHIVLHEEATNLDILKSTLALFLLRRRLVFTGRGQLRSRECYNLLEEVREESDRLFPLLLKQLSLQGWASPSRFMFGRVQQRAFWPCRSRVSSSPTPSSAS